MLQLMQGELKKDLKMEQLLNISRFTETMRDATGGVSPDVNWLIHDIKLLLGMDL